MAYGIPLPSNLFLAGQGLFECTTLIRLLATSQSDPQSECNPNATVGEDICRLWIVGA
jgi:hypothetical protein